MTNNHSFESNVNKKEEFQFENTVCVCVRVCVLCKMRLSKRALEETNKSKCVKGLLQKKKTKNQIPFFVCVHIHVRL